jgi:hypothetical protein
VELTPSAMPSTTRPSVPALLDTPGTHLRRVQRSQTKSQPPCDPKSLANLHPVAPMLSARLSTVMKPAPACPGTQDDRRSADLSASSTLSVQPTLLASNRSAKILASELAVSELTVKWSTTTPSALVPLASGETHSLSALKFLQRLSPSRKRLTHASHLLAVPMLSVDPRNGLPAVLACLTTSEIPMLVADLNASSTVTARLTKLASSRSVRTLVQDLVEPVPSAGSPHTTRSVTAHLVTLEIHCHPVGLLRHLSSL